jgi:hypothetical protein
MELVSYGKGALGIAVVKTLCCKPGGRKIEIR